MIIRVLAIDPGLAPRSCARAHLRVDGHLRSFISADVIALKKTDGTDARMLTISSHVSDALQQADLLVIEDQRGVGYGKAREGRINAVSRRLVGLVDMLRGVALVLEKPCVLVTPQQVRARLGLDRSASKQEVWNRACAILRGSPVVKSEHARDAVAIGIAGEMMWRVDAVMGRRSA